MKSAYYQTEVSDRTILDYEEEMDTHLFTGGASSVGAFRDRSCRFLDTACSRNDDDFVPRLLREKLSVCDLLTFRLNILGRVYRLGS